MSVAFLGGPLTSLTDWQEGGSDLVPPPPQPRFPRPPTAYTSPSVVAGGLARRRILRAPGSLSADRGLVVPFPPEQPFRPSEEASRLLLVVSAVGLVRFAAHASSPPPPAKKAHNDSGVR